MLRIGLTGSIASGKSTVLAMIAELGVPTFSSDAAVHRLYAGAAVAPVEKLFPGVSRDGVIDREELSRRLLLAPERLQDLEAAVHPLVRAEIAEFFADAAAQGARLAVVDIPLLFETGFDHGLDAVLVTVVDPAILRQRVLARPGMTGEKLATILARQLSQAEKRKRATHVIDTSAPLEETRTRVVALVKRLQAEAQAR